MSEIMTCPFCGYKASHEDAMLLHIEELHSEGSSPFVADNGHDAPQSDQTADDQYAECPIDGCEEIVTLAELYDHVEFHAVEEAEASGSGRSTPYVHDSGYISPYFQQEKVLPGGKSLSSHRDATNQPSTIDRWKKIFSIPSSHKDVQLEPRTNGQQPHKRLGKSELGRFAHEDEMPEWLVSLLRREGQVTSDGVMPVLAQLLEKNASTRYAYLCHPAVWHVSKLKKEGGFCGYRNIQMQCSYIIKTGSTGAEFFRGKLPSIFQIQDFIETAWDMGFNEQGRVETGGVRGTRKYIGTPEAQAMLQSLGIPCVARGFKDKRQGAAEAKLLLFVQNYFESGDFNPHDKVRRTSMPPIYFQHRGHSLTIIGLEKHQDGSTDLLVFDPMFPDSDSVTRWIGRPCHHKNPENALKLYRRGNKYLKKHFEFEVLTLEEAPPTMTTAVVPTTTTQQQTLSDKPNRANRR